MSVSSKKPQVFSAAVGNSKPFILFFNSITEGVTVVKMS